MRDGGRLLVVDWAPIETPHGPSLAVRVPAEVLKDFLREAGFSDIRTHDTLPWHSMLTAEKPATRD
jgi:hypothetical protein